MNELQGRELKLLKVFLDACACLDLHPYLVCGSALGAIKYQGFIPWDDDVDVALLRPEYELFLNEAQKLLPTWCFLQNYRTDPAYPHIYSKLRDTRTVLVERAERMLPITKGVFVDVFPLDGYPEGWIKRLMFDARKQLYVRALNSAFEHEGLMRRFFYGFFRLIGCHKHTARIAASYERMLRSCAPETSKLWCNHGNWQGRLEYAPREQYGSGSDASFEGVEVIVPEDFDAYLSQKYGDWRSDPPLDSQVSHHRFEAFDLGS